MALAQLSENGRNKLRSLEKEQKKVDFCRNNRVHNQTFDRLRDGEYVRAHVVAKVESLLAPPAKPASEDAVKRVITANYGIPEFRLMEGSRIDIYAEARMVAAWLLHRDGKLSKSQVAPLLGYSDHTGVLVAVKSVEKRLDVEADFRARVDEIRAKVRAAC